VKWAYQPAHAEDVPAAFMRAYAVALQPPGVSTVLPNSMASATDTLSWK
jgi:thiamine pyrophosphate-dependent acetolactate synthase large subunit-like protein